MQHAHRLAILMFVLFFSVMSEIGGSNPTEQDENWPLFWPAGFDILTGNVSTSNAVGDFDEDGNMDLAVTNSGSKAVAILLGTGTGAFSAPAVYGAGGRSAYITVGDFNEDGHQDLVVANVQGDHISILTGTGTGSFETALRYRVGNEPISVVVGDFNEDDHQDLAVANSRSDDVAILLKIGPGIFSKPFFYRAGDNPRSITLADFDEDGHQDLAVANSGSDDVAILLGTGLGSFTDASFHGAGFNPEFITVGDFDEDGHQDLVVAHNNYAHDPDDIAVLLGTGSGSFSDASFYGVGNDAVSIVVEDFDEDGHQDLAVANNGTDDVAILLGTGTGLFAPASFHESGGDPVSICVADFDEDGHPDLAVQKYATVSILLGTGSGSFANAALYEAGPAPTGIVIEDLDEDSHLDLAVTNDAGGTPEFLKILYGDGTGAFPELYSHRISNNPRALTAGDFNEDGHTDLAVATYNDSKVAILLNMSPRRFSEPSFYTVGDNPWSIAVGDFNEDGHQDLVTANYTFGSHGDDVTLLLGTGAGSFSGPFSFIAGDNARSIAVGDFNEDRHQDLAVAVYDSYASDNLVTVVILLGDGTGQFSDPIPLESYYAEPLSILVGDFNEDEHQDLAVGYEGSEWAPELVIHLGTGTGTFSEAFQYETGSAYSIASGDFNEDGHQDLALSQEWVGAIAVLLGQGTGFFSPSSSSYGFGGHIHSIGMGDLDEDGHQDLAVAARWRDTVAILLGNWVEIEVEIDCDLGEIPRGESLPIRATFTNRTDSSVTFQSTLQVKAVGGRRIPLMSPRDLSLPGGENVDLSWSIDVPENLPVGDYIVSLEAESLAGQVIDEDSFRVTVVGSDGQGFNVPNSFILKRW